MLANGSSVYRQTEHLSRLQRSSRALGITTHCNSKQIAEILSAALGHFNTQRAKASDTTNREFRRIRVTLTGGNSGEGLWGIESLPGSLIVIVQSHRLQDESLAVPAEVINSGAPLHWLAGHKSLSRMMYSHPAPNAGRMSAKTLRILYHPSCGVTEFTVASLFVRQGKTVLTGPDDNLFPGICRAEIIGRWKEIAPEFELVIRRIEPADLLAADEVIGVNSLRGAFALQRLTDNTTDISKSAVYDAPVFSPRLRDFLLPR